MQALTSILIVEDDPHIASMLCEALADDHIVECVADAPQALAVLARWRPDVVLLDCHLPVGRPEAVLEEAERMGCAMVLTSGLPEALERLAPFGYPRLCKPFMLCELTEAIAIALAQRQSAL